MRRVSEDEGSPPFFTEMFFNDKRFLWSVDPPRNEGIRGREPFSYQQIQRKYLRGDSSLP